MTIEIALLISIVSVCLSAVFGFAGYKRNNNTDVETQARRDAVIEVKLDQISANVNELKERFNKFENRVNEFDKRLAVVERKVDKAHERMDRLEKDE